MKTLKSIFIKYGILTLKFSFLFPSLGAAINCNSFSDSTLEKYQISKLDLIIGYTNNTAFVKPGVLGGIAYNDRILFVANVGYTQIEGDFNTGIGPVKALVPSKNKSITNTQFIGSYLISDPTRDFRFSLGIGYNSLKWRDSMTSRYLDQPPFIQSSSTLIIQPGMSVKITDCLKLDSHFNIAIPKFPKVANSFSIALRYRLLGDDLVKSKVISPSKNKSKNKINFN
jgi:hypothetical protein